MRWSSGSVLAWTRNTRPITSRLMSVAAAGLEAT